MGQSEGRRAAFPRPLANTADDEIKEGVPVEFTNAPTRRPVSRCATSSSST